MLIYQRVIYILHHIHTINPQVNLEFETKLAMGHHLVGINHEWVDILCYHKDIMGIYWDIYILFRYNVGISGGYAGIVMGIHFFPWGYHVILVDTLW